MRLFLEPMGDDEKEEMKRADYNATITTYVVAFVLTCIFLAAIFIPNYLKPCANFNQASLQVPNQILSVALATTPEQQSKGLGGCKEVPQKSGMYFVFATQEERTFWMKDMLISIDIIWIQDGKVVGVEKNVPNLPRLTPESDLPRYASQVPVDAVLEVGAGMAELYGIQAGVELIVDKKQAVGDTSPIL